MNLNVSAANPSLTQTMTREEGGTRERATDRGNCVRVVKRLLLPPPLPAQALGLEDRN